VSRMENTSRVPRLSHTSVDDPAAPPLRTTLDTPRTTMTTSHDVSSGQSSGVTLTFTRPHTGRDQPRGSSTLRSSDTSIALTPQEPTLTTSPATGDVVTASHDATLNDTSSSTLMIGAGQLVVTTATLDVVSMDST
jgi:hypothetical protein